MGGTYSTYERYKCLQYYSRKTPLGRPKGRWEDNIKTDLKEKV